MAVTPPPADLTGRTLGDFRVLRKIGQGGMGQVYLARQLSLNRHVALKILRPDHTANPTALRRFQAEAEAVAGIAHPNIVQVYAVGESDGARYMALEYVDGRNLREYLDRKGPPALPVVVAILKQVAAALDRAAEARLVHRDIKPENILLTRRVEVKVTDFGLARAFAADGPQPISVTRSGVTVGTPLYMSPEQVQGRQVDHRSDLYSLGVTAYHLLAGFPPFTGATAFEVALRHVQDEPEPLAAVRPDLPPELTALVHRLLAKNPADRPQSAKDVLRELNTITPAGVGEPPAVSGSQSAVAPLVSKPRTPSRWPWRVAAAILSAFAAGFGWWASSVADPPGETAAPTGGGGLPDVRTPTLLPSARESALREGMEKAPPHGRDHLAAAFDLGVLLVSERRWDEADRVFQQLEAAPRPPKAADMPVSAAVLGKLGQAVLLAHQDKWQESIAAFEAAVNAVPAKTRRADVERLCFDHPAIAQAVSEAVNRNVDNLPKGEAVPPAVRWLRTPASVLNGPK